MKKLFTLATLAMISIVANAQSLMLNKNMHVLSPSDFQTPAKTASTEGATTWGYYLGDASNISGLGTGSKGTFRVAIFLPGDGALKDAKIQGINLPVNTEKMSNVKVWGGSKLGGSDYFKKTVDSVSVGYTEVVLDDEVTVPEEGMYVGYTFTTKSASTQGEQYPIGVAEANEVAGSLYLSTSSAGSFTDYSGAGYGVSALQIFATDLTIVDNGAAISSIICDAVEKGTKGTAKVNIKSDCNNGVKTVGYTLVVNGVETTGTATLSPAVDGGFNKTGSFNVEFDAPETASTFNASVAINEVNGVANEGNTDAKDFNVVTVTRIVPHVTVVEEFTGTGCGYCPRGWAGMEYLKENRPDNCIGIAWHKYNSSDPMYVSSYASLSFSGAPSCMVDRRSGEIDPYYGEDNGIHYSVDNYSAIIPTVDISATAKFVDSTNKNVTVTADTEFLTDIKDYTIAVVLTADDLSGTTTSWKQTNYYYQYTKANAGVLDDIPALGEFCSGGSYGKSSVAITFNDVLIASTYSGGKSTISGVTSAAGGDVVSREATITMPTKTTLVNALKYDKIYANIIVCDENGYVANAKRVKVEVDDETAAGIKNVTVDANSDVMYNIAGQRVNGNAKGIVIVNGKKIIK